ncbi:hypothetical protein L6164_017784 [Bauhinia variegata]|uniref:Uncharacterized protein n=1 Tax=Bauhinia variegata TaxID=167791 RepID=A0ACB9NB59_BAUVA|nr:hypothetical protein L6164_017784 [Bauhinia variegata]
MNPCVSHPLLLLLLPSSFTSCTSAEKSQILRDYAIIEINAFQWLALIAIYALLLRKFFMLFRLWYKGSKIPGLPCPFFDGHYKLFAQKNLTDLLSESHKKYGSIVKLWLGPAQLLVSIKDPVLIQEMLVKAKDKLPFMGKAFRMAFGPSSLFASSSEKVRKRREVLMTELNERKNRSLFHHIDQNVYSEISHIKTKTADDAQCCSDADSRDYVFFHKLNVHQIATEEPSSNIMRVMFHGCQQTAALIANLLTMLVMHPEVQEKVYSEITMVMKHPSKYKEQDIYRMPLLLATVFESARLMPTGPLLQRCSLKHDLSFENGVTIPAGAVLAVPVHLVQMDDSSWGRNASDFNPYRFLSDVQKESDVVIDVSFKDCGEEHTNPGFNSFMLKDPNENAAFLSFGSGTRACVGQKFVIQVVASFFASLLKKYEVALHRNIEYLLV